MIIKGMRYRFTKCLQSILLFTILLIPFEAHSLPNKDYLIFKNCFRQPATGQCEKVDINKDGVINIRDYFLISQVFNYDLNADRVLDLSSVASGTDLNIFQSCVNQAPVDQCKRADFNTDGVINGADENLLWEALYKYDFDGDLRAEFYVDQRPVFKNSLDKNISEEKLLSFYIWATDGDHESVNYSIDDLPKDAEYSSVLFGDINDDGVVDDHDLTILNEAISDKQIYLKEVDVQFDLNNDRVIDNKDEQLLTTLVGTQQQALLFNWEPGDKQSGFYEIVSQATSHDLDGNSVSVINKFLITVVDRQSIEGYYDYDDVLLVINKNSADSQAIGNYFIEKREISEKNVVTINSSTNETVNWDVFYNDIAQPIQEHLLDNKLQRKIKYIVTTKGVPLRIYHPDFNFGATTATLRGSVDSQLTMLDEPLPQSPYGTKNPYYRSPYPFSSEMYGIFLVTRLTGYTAADAMRLVDNSSSATANGIFVFDVDPGKDTNFGLKAGNNWMRDANTTLTASGWDTSLDETNTYLTGQFNVLGYVSWGSNDSNDFNNAKPNNTWAPGAIAETYVSTSARTFTAPAVYGQSLVADWVAEGVTGIKGYAFEPNLAAMARPDILFTHYTDGFTLADSYFSSSPYIGWQGVVVGDPKTAIVKGISSGWKKSGAVQIAENWVINSSPTYTADGFNLFVEDSNDIIGCPFCYSVDLRFTSRNAGYGEREIVLPAITPHTIQVVVERGHIISIINDSVFDELNNKLLP